MPAPRDIDYAVNLSKLRDKLLWNRFTIESLSNIVRAMR